MSQIAAPSPSPSLGRGLLRWSWFSTGSAAQIAGSPASIAALPNLSFWVSSETSGPPLKNGISSFGSALLRSPGWFRAHEAPPSRLCPEDVIVPTQLPPSPTPSLLSTIVLLIVTTANGSLAESLLIPPPLISAALLDKVTLRSVTAEGFAPPCWLSKLNTPPPLEDAALAANEVFVTIAVPLSL